MKFPRIKALVSEQGLFVLALLATIAWAIASISYPLGSDQGITPSPAPTLSSHALCGGSINHATNRRYGHCPGTIVRE